MLFKLWPGKENPIGRSNQTRNQRQAKPSEEDVQPDWDGACPAEGRGEEEPAEGEGRQGRTTRIEMAIRFS